MICIREEQSIFFTLDSTISKKRSKTEAESQGEKDIIEIDDKEDIKQRIKEYFSDETFNSSDTFIEISKSKLSETVSYSSETESSSSSRLQVFSRTGISRNLKVLRLGKSLQDLPVGNALRSVIPNETLVAIQNFGLAAFSAEIFPENVREVAERIIENDPSLFDDVNEEQPRAELADGVVFRNNDSKIPSVNNYIRYKYNLAQIPDAFDQYKLEPLCCLSASIHTLLTRMYPDRLNLEECFQNGPPFQSKLANNENYILTCEALLKALSKTSKQAVDCNEQTSKANKAVSEAIEAIGKFEAQLGEDSNGIVVQFSELLKAIESSRKDMNKNIELFVNDPLENHTKSDLIYLKELKRKYEKDRLDFGYAYSRYMSKRPKDIGVAESAQEVANFRRELHDSSLSLAIHLNEMADKKVTFVYQSLMNYLNCRLEFAEKETAKLKEIKSHLDQLATEKIVTPDEHKERLMRNFLQKNAIISKSLPSYNPLNNSNEDSSVPENTSLDDNSVIGTDSTISLQSSTTATAAAASGPNRSGYLYKRSSHTLRPVWCRRFFSLKGDRLIYYSMEGKGDQARVGIDLRLCHVQAVDDPERRFCFDLISPIRGYRLQAENESDLQGWLEAIKAGTIMALQRNSSIQFNSHSAAKALSKELGLTRETGHEDLIHSILSMNQIELSLSAAKKAEIIAIPGNQYCADCKTSNPDWASLSFGILICIKCSGIHRSLGVHLSKVRSLALDFWNPEHVELMKELGNERSRMIFEEAFDEAFDEATRAEPSSNQQVKEKWIYAKYVQRRFVKFPEEADGEDLTEEDRYEVVRSLMWDGIERDSVVDCMRALALGASVDDECEANEDFLDKNTEVILVQSAVQRAAQLKHWRIVALLLLWGANSESLDSLGRNLVHYIAAIPDSSVSVLLSILRKNALLGGWEDSEGRTPLQYAEESANAPVATIIRIFQAQNEEKAVSSPIEEKSSIGSSHLVNALERVLQFKGPFKRKK